MKKIIAGLMAFTLMMGSIILPETATQILSNISIVANAATDAWGREYLTYGDLRYQVLSDNTISIIGFDVSKDTVEIPDEIDGKPVTKIGNYAFYNASYIVTVDIPDTVTYIGTKSFYKCKSLQIVTIPEGVTIIGNEAFRYCSALTSIDLPNTVEKIGDYAFSESGLVEMVLPESVETLSYRAFYSCNSLTTFKFPTEITTLGIGIFSYSKALESVTLPTNITSIPDKMFYHCEGLKNITIPDSVETIGDSSFCDCVSLEKIVIPSSVKTIKESAFEACTSLKTANLPEGVTSLGKYVFLDCTALEEITIPKSVTSAGNFIFFNCDNLDLKVYEGSYGQTYVNISYNNRPHTVLCESPSSTLNYQFAKGNEGVYSIRFLLTVDEELATSAEVASVYLMDGDGEALTDAVHISAAYRSVYASGKLVSAGEGKVFLVCTFRNVPKDLDTLTAHIQLDDIGYERTSSYSE